MIYLFVKNIRRNIMSFKNLTNEYLTHLVELYFEIYTHYGKFEKQIVSGQCESMSGLHEPVKKCKQIFEHVASCPNCLQLVKIIKAIISKNKKLEIFISEHLLYSEQEQKANEEFLESLFVGSLHIEEHDRMAIVDILDSEIDNIHDKHFRHFHIFERHIS